MKLTKLLFLFLVAIVMPATAFSQSNNAREVQDLERSWLNAYEQRDEKAMNAIVADDFLITFPNGSSQTKPQVVSSLNAPGGNSGTSMKFHTEDVKARVYGDTVILTGRVVAEWQRDGKPLGKERSRYTDTYIKRQGRWQVVASHLSNDSAAAKRN
ncbi:MAG: nuclear transport factor 2 family protein [Acidobacteriota bacterium]